MSDKRTELLNSAQEIVLNAKLARRPLTEDENNRAFNMVQEAKRLLDNQRLDERIMELEIGAQRVAGAKSEDQRDLGAKLVESDQFKSWSREVASSALSENARVASSPGFKLETSLFSKALITGLSDTSAGAFVQNDNSGIYQGMNYVQPTLRDLVQVRKTNSDTVDYVVQTTKITTAAAVPEATSVSDGLKPEGALAFARKSVNVETLAVWVPVTKRALADAGQLRSIINEDLKAALYETLENEILNGDGTPGFTGVANTAGVLTQAYVTDLLSTVRSAITQLSQNGEEATAIVLSPADWQVAEMALAASAPYLPYTKSLWRVPVVEYKGTLDAKTGYVGNWKKAALWDRESLTINMTDSHQDYFTRNLVAILAELRMAFAVIKPSAFVKIATAAA